LAHCPATLVDEDYAPPARPLLHCLVLERDCKPWDWRVGGDNDPGARHPPGTDQRPSRPPRAEGAEPLREPRAPSCSGNTKRRRPHGGPSPSQRERGHQSHIRFPPRLTAEANTSETFPDCWNTGALMVTPAGCRRTSVAPTRKSIEHALISIAASPLVISALISPELLIRTLSGSTFTPESAAGEEPAAIMTRFLPPRSMYPSIAEYLSIVAGSGGQFSSNSPFSKVIDQRDIPVNSVSRPAW